MTHHSHQAAPAPAALPAREPVTLGTLDSVEKPLVPLVYSAGSSSRLGEGAAWGFVLPLFSL